jgi:tRNA(Ile)-lysidine synthase
MPDARPTLQFVSGRRACDTRTAVSRDASALFLRQVRRTIDRYRMLVPGDRVLVAVSGGPDSVALLAALTDLAERYHVSICAAHFNHRLRAVESDRDQECAELTARRLGVPMIAAAAPQPAAAPNLEARAREQRYGFLEHMARAQECTRLATGHTLDDQAETVVMRLLRGAGADGLAGIPPVRGGRLIRPLIERSRAEVMAFLEARQLAYREDGSNRDLTFLRNRIRHEVLPLLASINPQVRQRLASAGSILAEECRLLDQLAQAAGRAVEMGETLRISGLTSLPRPLQARVVRAWLRARRGHLRQLTQAHFQAVLAVVHGVRPNATTVLPGGGRVAREYDSLSFRLQAAPPGTHVREASLNPGSVVELASGWRIAAEVVPASGSEPLPADLTVLLADASQVPFPVTVRAPRSGDRIRPLGMRGHRKLQDVFVDRKLRIGVRRAYPVVEANGQILWVPGVVRSAHALVTPATRELLRLTAQKTGIAGV